MELQSNPVNDIGLLAKLVTFPGHIKRFKKIRFLQKNRLKWSQFSFC